MSLSRLSSADSAPRTIAWSSASSTRIMRGPSGVRGSEGWVSWLVRAWKHGWIHATGRSVTGCVSGPAVDGSGADRGDSTKRMIGSGARKSVVEGKRVSERVDLGGGRISKKKKKHENKAR